MEEMAGNIVGHGFTKDNKRHLIDVRVVHKGDDIMKNIGIRMVFKTASDIQYQNILGLNVLTIRI